MAGGERELAHGHATPGGTPGGEVRLVGVLG